MSNQVPGWEPCCAVCARDWSRWESENRGKINWCETDAGQRFIDPDISDEAALADMPVVQTAITIMPISMHGWRYVVPVCWMHVEPWRDEMAIAQSEGGEQ